MGPQGQNFKLLNFQAQKFLTLRLMSSQHPLCFKFQVVQLLDSFPLKHLCVHNMHIFYVISYHNKEVCSSGNEEIEKAKQYPSLYFLTALLSCVLILWIPCLAQVSDPALYWLSSQVCIQHCSDEPLPLGQGREKKVQCPGKRALTGQSLPYLSTTDIKKIYIYIPRHIVENLMNIEREKRQRYVK